MHRGGGPAQRGVAFLSYPEHLKQGVVGWIEFRKELFSFGQRSFGFLLQFRHISLRFERLNKFTCINRYAGAWNSIESMVYVGFGCEMLVETGDFLACSAE